MTAIPSIQYVKSGDFTLAYQVLGDGPTDLIYLPNETQNIAANWFVPEHAAFMEGLASFSRLVTLDRRGLGCSDRLPPGQAPTLEEHVDDLILVMEAAYASPATIFAGVETAFIALLAAAANPDRFGSLVLWSPSPSWRRSDDLPWERSDDAIESTLNTIRRVTNLRAWAERNTRDFLPSWSTDTEKIAVIEALSALAGSAEAWYQDQLPFYGVDLRELLPSIQVPVLVLVRTGTGRRLNIESARFLAERLTEGRLVEFPGNDCLPWVGDAGAILSEIEEFVTGTRNPPAATRVLATILFTDIVDSTKKASELGDDRWKAVLAEHDGITRREVERANGRFIQSTGDGLLATFDGPARAVRCAQAISDAVTSIGLTIRSGCHSGEIELDGDNIRGLAVHIGARVAAMAHSREILVSQTVKDLVAGSGINFEEAGEHELKGVPDRWHLYRVVS